MQVLGKKMGFVVGCAWFLSVIGVGQDLLLSDSIILYSLSHPADSDAAPVKIRLSHEVEYSLSANALHVLNWRHGDNPDLVSFFHRLKYMSLITNNRGVKISNSFTHELGIQYYFDSISRYQPDENMLDTRMEIKIARKFCFSTLSNLTTRLFNAYLNVTDHNGSHGKILGSTFLTPLIWTFSIGFGITVPKSATFSLGLSAARFTWIRDRRVFREPDIFVFYGVPREKRHILEYGLSVQLLVDRQFLKRVHWNCNLLVFKNYKKPIDLVMKNLIGIRINRFLMTTVQTRLFYERDLSKKIQFENLITLGFYIAL
ncbi:MAG: hypothetical protein Q8M08_01525 [Bacteroidales bacterium]|nr:hypothetical protein [Bacteroidales bacterium]